MNNRSQTVTMEKPVDLSVIESGSLPEEVRIEVHCAVFTGGPPQAATSIIP